MEEGRREEKGYSLFLLTKKERRKKGGAFLLLPVGESCLRKKRKRVSVFFSILPRGRKKGRERGRLQYFCCSIIGEKSYFEREDRKGRTEGDDRSLLY